jgi:putative aldouronate transport system permease protein
MISTTKANKKNISNVFIHIFFVILSALFILPIVSVISISFSSENSIIDSGYKLLPKQFSTIAYEFVFRNPQQIIDSYKITLLFSLIGTLISVFIMLMCAYVLARKTFAYRKILSLFIFFTMLFNGGLVPSYILTTQYLKLQNTIWVLILSGLVNAWFIFVLRALIQEIPESIIESAYIDGAREFRIFISLIAPLSKPAIATVGLFVLLGYWNEWMVAILYIDNPKLFPLQYLLQRILQNLDMILRNMDKMPASYTKDFNVPSETVRMAMAVIAAGPMLFIMPFFQKYFVRGMTVGAVKG